MAIKKTELATVLKAVGFAACKHKDQRRKDIEASPYINHPISLANILCNEGDVEDIQTICAALLHDTIEDTRTAPEELTREFGKEVCHVVLEVSDDKCLEKAERKERQVEHAPQLSDRAKLVKLADKISNLRDVADHPPPDWTLQRRQEYFDWAKRVIDGLRGVHSGLEAKFDAEYARRPS